MNSMRLRPPRPPGNGQDGRGSRQRQRSQRRKFLYSGQNLFARRDARHDHDFAFPSEGKVPEGRMRCRLRVAEPFTNEKVTLCSVTRCRATPHSSASPTPSPQRGRLTVGFCFCDRDFMTASSLITSFSFSEKEKEGKRKTAQGVPPRSEIHYVAAGEAATQ